MRIPAVAGRFYPADKDSLTHELESCFVHPIGPGLPGRGGSERRIVSAISPHAGYRASGMNAAHVYKAIKEDGSPDAYIVIGPDHYGIPYKAAMCSDRYVTPFGPCGIHSEIAERLGTMIPDDADAHAFEHSVEVQLPFIQFIDDDPKIVPIIMRDQSMDAAKALAECVRKACAEYDVIIVASSDLSHNIPKAEASRADKEFLNKAECMDVPGMYDAVERNRMSICGYGPAAVSILASSPSSSKLLKYSDSCNSLGGDGSEVVGYGSMLFCR